MNKKVFIGILMCLIVGIFLFESKAQHTSHEIENMNPPDLYPKPGPGEVAIVRELQETNRLLQQQADLLKEQNRLLKETLAKLEPASPKPQANPSN